LVLDYKVKHDKFISFKEHSINKIENFFRYKRYFPRYRKLEINKKVHSLLA